MIDKYRCSDILSEISFNCIHLVFKKFTSIALCCTVDIRVSSYHVFIGFLTTQAFSCVTTQNLPRMLYLMLQDQLFSDNIIISCKMSWSATTVKTAIIVSFHTRLLSWSLIFHIFSRVLLESNQREPASHPYYRLVIKDVFHFQKSSAVFIKTGLFFVWLYRQCFTNESQTNSLKWKSTMLTGMLSPARMKLQRDVESYYVVSILTSKYILLYFGIWRIFLYFLRLCDIVLQSNFTRR